MHKRCGAALVLVQGCTVKCSGRGVRGQAWSVRAAIQEELQEEQKKK
jgi:hypothetical protein